MNDKLNPPWLEALYQRHKSFLKGNLFNILFAFTILFVVIGQGYQFLKVIFANSVEGVSALTFLLLAYNSFIGALYGIKQKDVRLVVGLTLASSTAFGTFLITLIRGGSI